MCRKYVIDEETVDKYGITEGLERVVSFTTVSDINDAIDEYSLEEEFTDLKNVIICAHNDSTLEEFIDEYENEFPNMTRDDIGSVYIDYILEKITNIEVVEPELMAG